MSRFSSLLPATEQRDLRVVVMLLVVLLGGLAITYLTTFVFSFETPWGDLVGGILFLALSAGLYRLTNWARIVTSVFLWFVLFLPIGLFGPFGDMDRGEMGVTLTETYKWTATVIIVILALTPLHVLGKHKNQFRKKFW